MEIFKPIKEFDDYEISNEGNVRSLISNRILKPNSSSGYYHVTLYKDGKQYGKKIHRLVAIAFIPNPDNLPCVNHKDENKLNNFVWVNDDGSVDYEKSNLEWCTVKYNSNYGTARERMSAKHRGVPKPYMTERNKRLCSKAVVAIDDDGNVVHEFASTREAERNEFNHGAVAACCRNCYLRQGNNIYKNFHWYYKDEWLKMQQATQSNERVACGKLVSYSTIK